MRLRKRYPWAGLSVVSLASILFMAQTGVVGAQPGQPTPLAGVPSPETNYPDGSRLRGRYETYQGGMKLAGTRAGMSRAAIGFAAAAEIQSRLPEGFTLQTGVTTQIMAEGAPQRLVPAREGARGEGQRSPGAKYVTLYPVEYHSIPLAKGSDYLTIVSEDGRLLATRERHLPVAVDATAPTTAPAAAVEVGRQHAAEAFAADTAQASEPTLEIWVDDQLKGHLSWAFTLQTGTLTDPKARRYWVAAIGTPQVLHWESEIYHTHFGTISGTLWQGSPLQATGNRPLRELEATRTGGGGGSQVTGDDGRYGFPTGSGNAQITARLRGPNSIIENLAGPVMERVQSGTPDTPTDLNFGASSEFELAQTSAFYWTNVAHHLANPILSPSDLPALPTRVNINNTCNAFYNTASPSINFFRAGGNCPNTAYADVVLHEYFHGVDHRKGGILDGGYSEGFGDAGSILGTRQPCLGRDFLGAGTCLRPATDVILWPPAPGEGVHSIGRRYAGFSWELVQQLKKTYAEDGAYDIAAQLILAAAAMNPSNIPDAVHLSFLADDDDGNLSTCSPHFKELAAAADSRKIPRPADCGVAAAGAPAASAQFPFTPSKKVNSNSNILEVKIHLDQPMEVHISANSSAQTQNAPLLVRTGFYNQPAANVMWTYSYRTVSLPSAAQWVNFGSKFAINLPAGDHTLYWKIWVSGGEVEFSSGTILVEGFTPSGAPLAVAALAEAGISAAEPMLINSVDEASGQPITLLK